jgi:hypothetical protein
MKRTTINVKVDPFPYPFDINVTPPLKRSYGIPKTPFRIVNT